MYFPCFGGLQYQTCSYKFCKIYKKHLSARLYVWLSCSDSACKFIKKETLTQIFSCESYKVFKFFFFYRSLYRSPPADYDYLCFASFFEILVKKSFWMILQSFRNIFVSTVAIAISILLSKNVKIPSMLSTAWSSSKKIWRLNKRPPRYCWHIPKILWKWPMHLDYFFSCDYAFTEL